MSDRRLEELIRRPAPGEDDATARAYEVARAAFESQAPARRRPGRLIPAVAAALVAAAIGAATLTPAGGAIANLIREGLGETEGQPGAEPALTSLPSGELLVVSEHGPWVVRADGSQRLLGRYDEASWSPGGLFVIASAGRQLTALTPAGEPRWSLSSPEPVRGARWSPTPGHRVAYLSGGSLRIVAGDGTGDRLESRHVAPVAPAWRPVDAGRSGREEVLAFADRAGRVEVRRVDTDTTLWRSPPGPRPLQLAWSTDGERLAAVAERSLRIFDGDGRPLVTLPLDAGIPAPAVAGGRIAEFARGRHQLALVRAGETAGQSEVVLLDAERRPGEPRKLFAGPGSFSDLAWSPDGRSLLVAWPSADQLLFLRPERPRRVTPVSEVARQFDPGSGTDAQFPRVSGWCCSP